MFAALAFNDGPPFTTANYAHHSNHYHSLLITRSYYVLQVLFIYAYLVFLTEIIISALDGKSRRAMVVL